MTFRILATPEPLLKRGHFVEFIGPWGDRLMRNSYVGEEGHQRVFQRVKFLSQMERDYRGGYLAAAATAPFAVDPDADMGFHPTYYDTIYQVRIGVNAGWNMYLRWPTGTYRGKLEDPAFVTLDPVATDDKKFIGVMSAARPQFGTSGGVMTTLEDATLTNGPAVPYNQILWINRIEISNLLTTDVRIVGNDSFTDTGGTARTPEIFNYRLVAGQTIGVDVEGSKKVLNQLQIQCTEGTPTAGNPVKVWIGGELETPKLDRFFEIFFIRDWMPLFHAATNSLMDYEKLLFSCLVNKLKIAPVPDPAIVDLQSIDPKVQTDTQKAMIAHEMNILARLKNRELPSHPLWHYSVYESMSV